MSAWLFFLLMNSSTFSKDNSDCSRTSLDNTTRGTYRLINGTISVAKITYTVKIDKITGQPDWIEVQNSSGVFKMRAGDTLLANSDVLVKENQMVKFKIDSFVGGITYPAESEPAKSSSLVVSKKIGTRFNFLNGRLEVIPSEQKYRLMDHFYVDDPSGLIIIRNSNTIIGTRG